ncbi:hypothetical protein EON67_03025 [archaeon]|nr:MAG: hypothetical protein EON67_03025 [archaeon]
MLPWSRFPLFPGVLQISIMKMVKHHNIVKLYEVLASRTKVRAHSTCSRARECVPRAFPRFVAAPTFHA